MDRLNGWKKNNNAPIRKAIKQQSIDAVNDFNTRLTRVSSVSRGFVLTI